MRNISQNLVFAFGYNTIGIPIAAGVRHALSVPGLRLSPMIAAAAMAMSSLSVASNSNRLRGFRSRRLASAGITPTAIEPKIEVGSEGAAPIPDRAQIGKGEAMSTESSAIDPVCGMTVDPATAEHRSVHDGTTYYFCSGSCEANFDKDPEKCIARGRATG